MSKYVVKYSPYRRFKMDKDAYLEKIVMAERSRLYDTRQTIMLMEEGDEKDAILAKVEEEIAINESMV